MRKFLCLGLAFAATACGVLGEDDDAMPGDRGSAAPKSEVQGTWVAACEDQRREQISFRGDDSFDRRVELFADADCSDLIEARHMSGSFAVVRGGQLKSEVADITVKPMAAATVQRFNREAVCGARDWAFGVERSVVDAACVGQALRGEAAFAGTYELRGGALYLHPTPLALQGEAALKRSYAKLPLR